MTILVQSWDRNNRDPGMKKPGQGEKLDYRIPGQCIQLLSDYACHFACTSSPSKSLYVRVSESCVSNYEH